MQVQSHWKVDVTYPGLGVLQYEVDANLCHVQLCLPPALVLAAAVAEAHATARSDGPGTSYPRLDDLGQNMRYTAALLWASGKATRKSHFAQECSV